MISCSFSNGNRNLPHVTKNCWLDVNQLITHATNWYGKLCFKVLGLEVTKLSLSLIIPQIDNIGD